MAVRSAKSTARTKLGTRGQPEQTRAAILDAARVEFGREGLAGARTDAIARAARVNKALLYYYFHSKEELYGAVLDSIFSGLREKIGEALDREAPPRERLLAYVAAHFDYIAASPDYPRLVYRELMRVRTGGKTVGQSGVPQGQARRLITQYFRPTFHRVTGLIQEGIKAGEFRPVDATHFMLSMVACIVFYFTSTPVLQAVTGTDPLAPERVAARRAAVLDMISAALLVNYKGGQSPSRKQRSNA